MAQGNSEGKGKGKEKQNKTASANKESNEAKEDKDEKNKSGNDQKFSVNDHNKKIWEGTKDKNGDGPKYSKNQPAKVREAFNRDYPNARNVSWTKYRGDWTATFGNGVYHSTAIYHANGERRDTRTIVTRNEMPKNVLDSILKRRPNTRLDEAIKIQVPNVIKDIFRVKDIILGKPQYLYFNSDGIAVKYDY